MAANVRPRCRPGEWHIAQIVALYKGKGLDDSQLMNYRPISLLHSLYKLYTSVLLARFQEALGDRVSRWHADFDAVTR